MFRHGENLLVGATRSVRRVSGLRSNGEGTGNWLTLDYSPLRDLWGPIRRNTIEPFRGKWTVPSGKALAAALQARGLHLEVSVVQVL